MPHSGTVTPMTASTERPTDPASQVQSGTQALIRGLRVLEGMAKQERPIGVGELSRQLKLPKSTVQRLLRTLDQEGWVQATSDPVTRWQLSPDIPQPECPTTTTSSAFSS